MISAKVRDAAQEILIRREARRSMYSYLDLMRHTHLPDFQFTPEKHHRLMIDGIHNMVAGKLDRASYSFPPGSAKSTYSSVVAPTWLLAADPSLQILCISNSQSLAESFSRRRRAAMQDPQWERISGTKLLPDAKSLEFQGTPEGGGIRCLGVGSSVTGFRCDYLFVDDVIVGFEQANSIEQLDKIFNWYLSEARSRLKPTGKQLIVGTRWASQDLTGRLIEFHDQEIETWKHIRVPMECDSPYDPLGREFGERLWPTWFTQKTVNDAQRDPKVWQCLYQQRPLDAEGCWCHPDHVQVARIIPAGMKYYIGVDLALSIQKGDFTAFVVVGIDYNKGLFVVDVIREQKAPNETADTLINLCGRYPPACIFIDNDGPAKVWSNLVWEKCRSAGKALPIQLVAMQNKDKETRAAALRAYLLQDRIFFKQANWNGEVFDELLKFPGGRHDDVVDAIGIVCRRSPKLSAPQSEARKIIDFPRQLVPHQFPDGRRGFALNGSMSELFDLRESQHHWNKGRI